MPRNNINEIFKIKNSTSNSADIYFYGDIVSDEWSTWSNEDQYPENIKNLLEGQNGKALNIYINSGGGSVFAGIAIYNILKRHNGYKTVYVDGLAASIASVIAFAGDKLVIPKNAFLMVHKPWNYCIGNANDLQKEIEVLNTIEQSMLNIYQEHLKEGVDIKTIADFVDKETWFTGEQAAEYFNIEVSEKKEIAACADISKFKNAPKNLKIKAENSRDDTAVKLTTAKIKSLCISGITKGV
jgi:ATP-dependent protease ClpP protease subunit